MKKIVLAIALVGMVFSGSSFSNYETNEKEGEHINFLCRMILEKVKNDKLYIDIGTGKVIDHINFLCCKISETVKNDNNLYIVDGIVIDRNGKKIGFSFPSMSTLSSFRTPPKNIFFYTKSIDEFPEYRTMKNPRVYKIRRILARNVSSRYGSFNLDSKSESKTKGFIIDVRDLYSIVGNDDELFIKTIVSGNRARLEVRKNVSPAAFRAIKSSSFVVEYDCECKIDDYYNYDFDDCEETHWSVRIHVKYKDTSESFWGYIPITAKDGTRIYSILRDGKYHNLNLTLRYPKTKESPDIVQIISLNKEY